MCDPMMGLSLLASAASAGINYASQSAAMSAQNSANAQWVSYQRKQSQQEWARQEKQRQTAETARQQSLTELTPEAQKAAQGTEATRLQTSITPDALKQPEQLIGDMLLSGQRNAAAPVQAAISDRVTSAARDARQRIAALATLSSYGGSQGGLQTRANDIFNTSGQAIGLSGNIRQGSLGAYQVEKAVQPEQFQATPSPWGGIASAFAGVAGKGLGARFS